MPKIIFTKPYNYRPSSDWRITKSYKPSEKSQAVSLECAENAVAAGVARYADEEKMEKRLAKEKSKVQTVSSEGVQKDIEGNAEGSPKRGTDSP